MVSITAIATWTRTSTRRPRAWGHDTRPAAACQSRPRGPSGEPKGGHDPDRHTGHNRRRQPDADDPGVQRDLRQPWHLARGEGHQHRQCPTPQQESERAAEDCEHDRLGDQLPEEAAAAGSQGTAHGHFADALGAPRADQCRHIGTCDEEREQRRSEEYTERGLHLTDLRAPRVLNPRCARPTGACAGDGGTSRRWRGHTSSRRVAAPPCSALDHRLRAPST